MTIPEYLVIGTITKDLIPDGFTIGGTVTYAAVTASRLGMRAGIVTSAGTDLVLPDALKGVQVVCAPSQATTTFRNIYVNGVREQYISALAEPIGPEAIPLEWRQTPLVHLGPLVRELDESLVHLFPNSWVIATAQGWFRSWDDTGRVSLGAWERAEQLLPHLTALILGEEDICGDPECVERYASSVRTLVLTHGAHGSTVYHDGQVRHFPTRPAREVDLTGAGDVFAAAFLIRLYETFQTRGVEDPWDAARFANVVGSFSVEGLGTSAIPSREQVEAYLQQTARA
ncbi:MAG: PfkB family carbohydrate kinase [Anaerolineae bacterium]